MASGVMEGLHEASAEGSAVLIATHDEEVIAQAPRHLALRDARLVD
jgi:ABC-type ATPase involved in cell division